MKLRRIGFWFIAVCSVLLVISLFGDQGIIALYKNRQQLRKLETEIKLSHRMIDSLRVELEKLKNDTGYIERIAREKLGMARRDEKIFKFVEENN